LGHDLANTSAVGRVLGVALTFLAVVVGWVFFRAQSLDGALAILSAMAGLNGVALPEALAMRAGQVAPLLGKMGVVFTSGGGRDFVMNYIWVLVLLPVVFLAPNTQQIMGRFKPALDHRDDNASTRLAWTAGRGWAVVMALVLACGLLSLTRPSEFLYFQF
jgi:hypothetical protein